EYLQESAFTREELATYDKYWDSISSERTLIEDAYSEGEEKKALSIARSMKAKGFDTPTIAELTGLSPELIERL
ncbi:MAG: hypothetical protein MRY86_24580, partial [Phaeodactylibacter sp.]